jgi:RNA polymerase primary sigma factor
MRQLKIANKITARDSQAFETYLNEIGKIDLLTPEQEVELARRIREGDEDALNKLVRANLRFVVSVAKQYQNHGLGLNDMINEGNLGLLKAAKRFDETKGFRFISYAVWWIRQTILQAIVEHSRIVRIPLNKVSNYNKVNNKFLEFLQEFEREPSAEELADLLDMKESEVVSLLSSNVKHVSVDAPMSDDEESSSLLDIMSVDEEMTPDFKLLNESLVSEIKDELTSLGPREKEIIMYYFGLNGKSETSLEDIGDYLGLSKERVRQIRDRAISKLRRNYNKKALTSYLRK